MTIIKYTHITTGPKIHKIKSDKTGRKTDNLAIMFRNLNSSLLILGKST